MPNRLVSDHVAAEDVADILLSLAALMETFHQSDIALQNALSGLPAGSSTSADLSGLQHVDLVTQTHRDLARLLPILASSARGVPTPSSQLKEALTLRSLQGALIEGVEEADDTAAGDVSFF